jgi:effector-binding domain-containing protein
MNKTVTCLTALLFSATLFSCGGSDKKEETTAKKTAAAKKDSTSKITPANIKKPPIINITDTVSPRMTVVYLKDSAATFERISLKLGQIYGVKLAQVFKQNKIRMVGQPMAWYKTTKAPYFFEAGIPVNKKPAKLAKGIFVRDMGADSVTVAHFYGPYDMMAQGYDAVKERMKDMRRKAKAAPYEIYVSDPIDKNGKMLDAYKVRTDIVFPAYGFKP